MRTYFTELYQRFLQRDRLKLESLPLASSEIIAAHAAGSLLGLLSWLKHEVIPSAEDM